jgi:hypothetical protein
VASGRRAALSGERRRREGERQREHGVREADHPAVGTGALEKARHGWSCATRERDALEPRLARQQERFGIAGAPAAAA